MSLLLWHSVERLEFTIQFQTRDLHSSRVQEHVDDIRAEAENTQQRQAANDENEVEDAIASRVLMRRQLLAAKTLACVLKQFHKKVDVVVSAKWLRLASIKSLEVSRLLLPWTHKMRLL